MGVESTTIKALRELVITTVQGVTPSAERGKTRDLWRNRRGNHRGPVSNNTRAFNVELYGDRRADDLRAGWTTNTEVRDVTCIVVADYSIRMPVAYDVVAADNADLRDALADLHIDSTNGIWEVRDEEFTDPPEDSEGAFQVAHEFTITYQRARSYGS